MVPDGWRHGLQITRVNILDNFLNQLVPTQDLSAHRCVVFAPHPDDEVFGCGGTLALLARQGAHVQTVIMTDGTARREDAERTKAMRQAESVAAAAVLGLPMPAFWNYGDGELANATYTLVERIRAYLVETCATVVFTPSAFERHPDHHALAVQVTQAVQTIDRELLVVYCEIGDPLFYNTLVDISSVAADKQRAMECFVSELEFQRYDVQVAALNRYRTYTLRDKQAQLAEAFLTVSNREVGAFEPYLFASDAAHRWELGQLMSSTWTLRGEIANLQQQLAVRTSRQTELEVKNFELEKTRDAQTLKIELLKAQLDELHRSRSWRLTAPLRAAADIARRVKRSVKTRILELGLRAYRYGPTGQIISLLPTSVKRRLRHTLQQERDQKPLPTFSGKLSEKPLVSVVIPIYNHANYLTAAITSALHQTYENIEVIAVNDASPDPRVREILDNLKDNPKLTVIHNEANQGISRTQNTAMTASKGEIIAFLDCDDILEPDAIETCLRFWKPDTVYSHSARINIDENDKEIERICFDHLPRSDYFNENLKAMFATHFKMIRRDVFAKVGLFDPRFDAAQDYDILMRTAFHYPSSAFVYVPYFVYKHRLHKGQTTEKKASLQQLAAETIRQEAKLRQNIRKGNFEKYISIIMLSFGKQSQTLEAIKSLESTVKIPHEIILFDNGSDPETIDFIRSKIDGIFANVKVYYSPTNLGPAAGRREALKNARGDWFIIFDNDETAESGWIEELLTRAMSDEQIGAVCAKVIFPNRRLQFSGGYMEYLVGDLVRLQLFDRDKDAYDISTADFKDCDWCPIGATLFKINPKDFLHEGYPNVFEDAGVSMALRRKGYRLVNSPASWVWHEHMMFQKKIEMGDRYTQERYNPKRMLISVASFYKENNLIIEDEYVWRENNLYQLSNPELKKKLNDVANNHYPK